MTRRLFLLLFSLSVLACNRAPTAFHSTDLTGAAFARQLSLTDHNGEQRSLSGFHGKAVVLFFGYTSCPDICPTMLARLADVMKSLGDDAARVQVLFVTIDPERDTLQRIKEFVPWFHPAFLGLRGDVEQTRVITEEFRIFAARKAVDGELGYVMDHSSGAYVYDPAGRLRLYLRDSAGVDEIASDIRLLLQGN